MKLTEEEKTIGKRYYEITNSILGLKLGLFHVSHEFSDPEITDHLRGIESDYSRLEDFIYQGLDLSNAQKRFKDVKLTKSAKKKKPHDKMNEYLTEAFWCYVAGMFKACVALCRTAMEIGIRDQVNEPTLVEYKKKNCDELIQEEKKHWEKGNIKMDKNLRTLIEVDLKTLYKRKEVSENKRKELKKSAHCIRIKGNIIAHSQKDTADREQETRDVLLRTREFLAEIYNL
jgi:hypothetical protein